MEYKTSSKGLCSEPLRRKRLAYAIRASRFDVALVFVTAVAAIFVSLRRPFLIGVAVSLLLFRSSRLGDSGTDRHAEKEWSVSIDTMTAFELPARILRSGRPTIWCSVGVGSLLGRNQAGDHPHRHASSHRVAALRVTAEGSINGLNEITLSVSSAFEAWNRMWSETRNIRPASLFRTALSE